MLVRQIAAEFAGRDLNLKPCSKPAPSVGSQAMGPHYCSQAHCSGLNIKYIWNLKVETMYEIIYDEFIYEYICRLYELIEYIKSNVEL